MGEKFINHCDFHVCIDSGAEATVTPVVRDSKQPLLAGEYLFSGCRPAEIEKDGTIVLPHLLCCIHYLHGFGFVFGLDSRPGLARMI